MNKLIRRIAGVMMAAVTALSLAGCSGEQRIMFGTGGTAGTYYAYGGVLAQAMRNYAGIRVTAVSTGGSKANIQTIQDGDFQLGFTQSDVLDYAWDGTPSRRTVRHMISVSSAPYMMRPFSCSPWTRISNRFMTSRERVYP